MSLTTPPMNLTRRAYEIHTRLENATSGTLPPMARPFRHIIYDLKKPLLQTTRLLVDVCQRLEPLPEPMEEDNTTDK